MKLFFTCIWIFILSVAHQAAAQNGEIKGRILTPDNKLLEGVTVTLKDTKYGNTTSFGGKYYLKAPAGIYTMVISILGNEKKEQQVEVKPGKITTVDDIQLSESAISLGDAVVTGQFEKQSLRNSVYQVRTIDNERIRLRGATNIQSVLNTELGIRFSNDMVLGTTDIQLMGLKGQNVKILLDGVPMVDRGETRESLGQIDINTIERIEIVEGPMSVIYGTDALAGVINIITKKGEGADNLILSARIQEETVSNEYNAFTKAGSHNANLGVSWQKKGFQVSGSLTRNNFGGWQGDFTGRAKTWLPKEQMLYSAGLGYAGKNWNVWYRFNGTDETIKLLGNTTVANTAGDKDYITKRWFHQAQGEYRISEKLDFSGALSYTDYSRRTLSTNIDLNTGRRTLALDAAAQDKAIFTTTFFRGIAKYKLSPNVFFLPGIEINNNSSSGQRIKGSPTINEYAFFVSSELKVTPSIKLSPGVRFIKNSVYDAPPVIPSLNAKISLSKSFDLRMAYARGFRSPALRELYFDFHDASHSIDGNENLKAEYSNSYNTFLVWNASEKSAVRFTSTLGAFYNVFHDRIDIALIDRGPNQSPLNTYLNISLFKTTGFSLENKLFWKNLQATIGGTYIGTYNNILNGNENVTDVPQLVWSPEVNTNLIYTFPNAGASINLFYKFTGVKPAYTMIDKAPVLTQINSYHIADLTATKTFGKYLNIIAGAKNLFNVTSIRNTTAGSGHDETGPSFSGRSYFVGLNIRWSKN